MILNGVNLKEETLSNTNPPNQRRGEVWNVNSDPTVGSQIRRIPPALVFHRFGFYTPLKFCVGNFKHQLLWRN